MKKKIATKEEIEEVLDKEIKTTKSSKSTYKVTLKVNGEEYKGEGEEIDLIITSIKPRLIKTTCFITVEKGKSKVERFLLPNQAYTAFRTPLSTKIYTQRLILN